MKQNASSKKLKEENCSQSSSLDCANCKAVNFEERRPELKTAVSQLYAKELENYVFYYDLRIRQTQ